MKILLLLIIPFVSFSASLENVEEFFNQGEIFKALEELNDVKTSNINKNYWKGKSYLALQDYEKAYNFFSKALTSGFSGGMFDYEYAQAAYHINELNVAKKHFRIFLKKNPKDYETLYYLGDILRMQNGPRTAKGYFNQIIDGKASDELKQGAAYQVADIESIELKKKRNKKKYLKDTLIPLYEKALDFDSSSDVGISINNRIYDLKVKYKLESPATAKKRRRFQGSVKQIINYDSNVLLIPDDSTSAQAQNKSSFVSQTRANGAANFSPMKRLNMTTGMNLTFDRYFDRTNRNIYQNDEYTINPFLRNSFSHKLFGKSASLLFDASYNLRERDLLSEKDLRFFSRNFNFAIGEMFDYFKFGKTIIKAKYQRTYFYSSILDSTRLTLSATQMFNLPNKRKIIGILGLYENDTRNEVFRANSYYATAIYKDPYLLERFKYLKKFDFKAGLSVMLADYREQPARGVETNLSPFFEIERPIYKMLNFSARYSLTKNLSSADNFDYTRHQIQTAVSANF